MENETKVGILQRQTAHDEEVGFSLWAYRA